MGRKQDHVWFCSEFALTKQSAIEATAELLTVESTKKRKAAEHIGGFRITE
jgi:hypothetical protein